MSSSKPTPNHHSTAISRSQRGPQATADERRHVVAQWRYSGLTIRAFARQVGMYPSTLSTWIRKYLTEVSTAGAAPDEAIPARGFIPAVPPATGSAPAPLVWYLPSGLGAVQGDAGSLGPLLVSVLQGLQR